MSSTSIIENFTVNLNERAKENKIDPIFGREKELKKIASVLLKRTKNNPLLLGLPGVGKTAIAEALASSIVNETCHHDLFEKQVLLLDTVGLVSNTKERGSLEERLTEFVKELQERDDIILMIDEIHVLLKSQSASESNNSLNIANILKPSLARGKIHCIGATTFDEYSKYFYNDKAFERRFQPIYINEPSQIETLEILKTLKVKYEEYHSCVITDDALESCVNLSYRFLSYRNFPDKAIDLMDEACSKLNIDCSKKLRTDNIITRFDIEDVIRQQINVPLRLEEDKNIMMLDICLKNKIVGQDNAIDTIIKTIKRQMCGFNNKNRPIASMMFLGPTGTGKTETVNLLADYYFGSRENNIIRFDMSEYSEPFTVSMLLGSPPGFVGYEEGGRLTNAIKRNPYSIVLFDEIEKAHYKVFDSLLQILEDGLLTDGKGNHYSFKNSLIIFTSNIGFTHKRKEALGFKTMSDTNIECTYNLSDIHDELKYTFRPEFLNRIDCILPFEYLTEESIIKIANDMIHDFIETVHKTKGLHVVITNETKIKVYEQGMNPDYGARPLRHAITKNIIDPVCERLLNDNLQNKWIIV